MISYIAWKKSRSGFTRWHLTRDAAYSLCGRRPEGIISTRMTKPAVEETCSTCRERWVREGEIK